MKKKAEKGKNTKSNAPQISDKERVDKGQVLVRIILEVLGAPKEHVEKAIQLIVDRMHTSKDFEVVSESTYEAEKKGELFSTFSEIEIWFKDIDSLIRFIFDFTPSSIEILQPSKIMVNGAFVSGFCNDFLLKMHDLALKLKDTSAKVQVLQRNADALVRNFMKFILDKSSSVEEIAKISGIPVENVMSILETFEKAKLVSKNDGKYEIIKK